METWVINSNPGDACFMYVQGYEYENLDNVSFSRSCQHLGGLLPKRGGLI